MCLLAVLVIVKMWDTTFNVSSLVIGYHGESFEVEAEANCKAYLGTKCDVRSMCFLHHVCHTNYWRHVFLSFCFPWKISTCSLFFVEFFFYVTQQLCVCLAIFTFWYSRHSVFSPLCMRVWGVCCFEISWDLIYLQASVSVWCDRPTIWWT